MYDIRQFRPALYVLLVMGMTGFALAAQWAGVWVLSVLAIGINAWLVMTDRFKPMPRIVANIVTLAATAYIVLDFRSSATPILHIGLFLVLMQVIKLYEQRANRDYAQLLVLSLLLMVAAAISTASLVFGILFIAYLFLSLYCCLLFHLKVETDQAKLAMALPEDKANLATLRQDQKFLASSMRRLTGLISTTSVCSAVVAFLFIPRGPGAGMLGQLQIRPNQNLTGFSETVSFQKLAQITQNNDVVAYVRVWKDEEPVTGTQPLQLRGMTLDVYHGLEAGGSAWQWSRSTIGSDDESASISADTVWPLAANAQRPLWRQRIQLRPTGTSVLFAMAGPVSIMPVQRDIRSLRYSARDQVLRTEERMGAPVEYEVVSNNIIRVNQPSWRRTIEGMPRVNRRGQPQASSIDPQILAFAELAEVTGGLAEKRTAPPGMPDVLDEQIAKNIEKYLKSNFTYTLNLRDAEQLGVDENPMVAFLYRFRQGHCEYFAGSMTLMCQSLGMQARMVIGFRCDDFNTMGGYYRVKQSDAHAWVEVLTTDGWKSFDPTSGRGGEDAAARGASLWRRVGNFFDYLEFTWANSVIAYDNDNRKNLIENLETKLTNTAITTSAPLQDFKNTLKNLLRSPASWPVSPTLIWWLICLMVVALLVAIVFYVRDRLRRRRRAHRMGIDSLPSSDQARLLRQLVFYDDMLQILERNQIRAARHLTPKEFSDSLTFLPNEAYDTIRRLTAIFYRIRFGRSELDPGRQKRLSTVLDRLGGVLDTPGKSTGLFRDPT